MFDFYKAYRVMRLDKTGGHLLGIAVGVRPFSAPFPNPHQDRGVGSGFEWIPNSLVWPVRRAFLDVVRATADRVEAKSKLGEFAGNDVTYVFEPLTVEKLAEVQDDILGFDTFVSDLASDDDIQEFYVSTWLRPEWTPAASIASESVFDEGKAYEVGTVRPRADGYDWQKMPNHQWVRIRPTLHVFGPEVEDDEEGEEDLELVPVLQHGLWIDKAEGLPESTFEAHFENDPDLPQELPEEYRKRPNGARQRVHNTIMKRLRRDVMEGRHPVPDDQQPVAVLTMGVPASGKSAAVAHTVAGTDFVHVDPDRIKEYIPEYRSALAQRAKNAAHLAQTESGWLAEQLRDEAISRRMNLVFEGVGRDPEYYRDMIQWMQVNGYRVKLVMTHIENVEAAVERSVERGEKTGRWVNERYIRSVAPVVPRNFMALKDEVDDVAVFNADSFPLKLAWAREGGEEHVPDPDLKERLMKHQQAPKETVAGASTLPAAISHTEIVARFLRAWERDHVAITLLPRGFTADEGTTSEPGESRFRRHRKTTKIS